MVTPLDILISISMCLIDRALWQLNQTSLGKRRATWKAMARGEVERGA
jgi:hypothetical protein